MSSWSKRVFNLVVIFFMSLQLRYLGYFRETLFFEKYFDCFKDTFNVFKFLDCETFL